MSGTLSLLFLKKRYIHIRPLNHILLSKYRYKLLGGLAVRRACYGVLRFIMESGAKGCEVIVSGKLRAARAKAMKFKEGYMIKSGDASRTYVDTAVRHVAMRQGMLGLKVSIMLPQDPEGKLGPRENLSDIVTVLDPKPLPPLAAKAMAGEFDEQ